MAKIDFRNLDDYLGKTFVTAKGRAYHISSEGGIHGRPSIEGEKIEMLAGIKNKSHLYHKFKQALDFDSVTLEKDREYFESLISKYGQRPIVEGLRLVILLTEESNRRSERLGLITREVIKILSDHDASEVEDAK